nr:hypothetical protein [Spirochaetaceae bacterium]
TMDNQESQKIQYSSNHKDIKSATSERQVTDLWRNSEDYNENLALEDNKESIVFNDNNDSIIYRIPVRDYLGIEKGVALIYFSSSGFKEYLFSKGLSSSNSLIQIFGSHGLIIDMKDEQLQKVSDKLLDVQNRNIEQPYLISENMDQERFFILNRKISDYESISDLNISIVIKESELELSPVLIIVLLILFFTTFFLIFFLIFNIRQDRSLIIASRIKKFQLNFLIDYIDKKSDLNWETWERDMRSRRDQVRKEFKKGLGRFQKEEEDIIDKLIDNNWDEIISVLSKKKEEKEESKEFDLKRIEQILQKALKNVNFTVSSPTVQKSAPIQVKKRKPIEVEDLSEEEDLEEMEDLGEPIEVEDFEELNVEEKDIPVSIEELEQLYPIVEFEELPLIEEEELEMIPVYAGTDEASLMDVDGSRNPLDVIDISSASVHKEDASYYDHIGILEYVSGESDFDESLEIGRLPELGDLDMLDDVEELDEFEELEELDEIEEPTEPDSYIKEIPYSLFFKKPVIPVKLDNFLEINEDEISPINEPDDSVYQNEIEDEVDFVHIYSDDLLPQFVNNDNEAKELEQNEKDTVFRPIKGGFDFDSYASSRKDEYKALIGITREVNAVGGIIFASENNEYKVELSLGIGHDLMKRLATVLLLDDLKEITIKRNLIYIEETQHSKLENIIFDADRRFLKSILFVPVYYNKKQAYLFLGIKKSIKNIEKLIKSIV